MGSLRNEYEYGGEFHSMNGVHRSNSSPLPPRATGSQNSLNSPAALSLSRTQMLCCHCEEYISRSADVCPYCNTDVLGSGIETDVPQIQKITRLYQEGTFSEEDHEEKVHSSSATLATLTYISALVFFLIGEACFFLGIVFPLLAHNGTVTLSWNESLWLPLLGIGLGFLIFGYFFLQRIEVSFKDS